MNIAFLFKSHYTKPVLSWVQPGKPWKDYTLDDAFATMNWGIISHVLKERGTTRLERLEEHMRTAIELGDSVADILYLLLRCQRNRHYGFFLSFIPQWKRGHFRSMDVLLQYVDKDSSEERSLREQIIDYLQETGDESVARYFIDHFPTRAEDIAHHCNSIELAQKILELVEEDSRENNYGDQIIGETATVMFMHAVATNNLELARFLREKEERGEFTMYEEHDHEAWFIHTLITKPLTPLRKEVLIEVMHVYPQQKHNAAFVLYMLDDQDLINQPFELQDTLEEAAQPLTQREARRILKRCAPNEFLEYVLHCDTTNVPEYRLRELVNKYITPGRREWLTTPLQDIQARPGDFFSLYVTQQYPNIVLRESACYLRSLCER